MHHDPERAAQATKGSSGYQCLQRPDGPAMSSTVLCCRRDKSAREELPSRVTSFSYNFSILGWCITGGATTPAAGGPGGEAGWLLRAFPCRAPGPGPAGRLSLSPNEPGSLITGSLGPGRSQRPLLYSRAGFRFCVGSWSCSRCWHGCEPAARKGRSRAVWVVPSS